MDNKAVVADNHERPVAKLRAGYLARTFPALTHGPFRWFWCGQIVSLIGTWTQNVGQAWLVLQLTNSAFLLGLVGALQFLPMLLLSLHAGVWIDRLPKRKILLISQSTLMVLAFVVAGLVGTGLIRYWMLAVLATILGIANTVDVPARQSFVIELVGREHLTNAIALNSAIFNGARLVGPAVAGTIMALWGPTWCFLINGASFIGVVTILAFLPSIPKGGQAIPTVRRAVWPEIREGLAYIRHTPVISVTLGTVAVLSAITMNFNVLVPVLAKMELHAEVLGYGLLMSSMGLGALLGALTVAASSRHGPRKIFVFGGAAGLALFAIVLGLQTTYAGAALALGLMGWSMLIFSASANSLVQMTVDDRLRGRVMSVYSLVFGGMTPLGSFYSGTLAHFWGARLTFAFSGLLALLFLAGLALSKRQLLAKLRC